MQSAQEIGTAATSYGYNSATPPYDSWVIDWQSVLPYDPDWPDPDVKTPVHVLMVLDGVDGTATSIGVDLWEWDHQVLSISGGPFTVGQTVRLDFDYTPNYPGIQLVLTPPTFTTHDATFFFEDKPPSLVPPP